MRGAIPSNQDNKLNVNVHVIMLYMTSVSHIHLEKSPLSQVRGLTPFFTNEQHIYCRYIHSHVLTSPVQVPDLLLSNLVNTYVHIKVQYSALTSYESIDKANISAGITCTKTGEVYISKTQVKVCHS